jgi:hypothetical protein
VVVIVLVTGGMRMTVIVIVAVIMFTFFRHFLSLCCFLPSDYCLMPVAYCLLSAAYCLFLFRRRFHDLPLLVGHLHDRQPRVTHQIEVFQFRVGFYLRERDRLWQGSQRLDIDD